ncbi:D-alanine--D-alanine ligase [Neisseria sp. Ec49-e6-T10]|uniref:D-alanine--D-alanine ligase n=1 Tax=Neisseria sp. Ec49-e6-T10 TaxID=3140744 RepID=UPI003EB9C781
MQHFGKVAVLFGGTSHEREVSLASGQAVLNALKSKGVDAHPFDPAHTELIQLKREKFNRVFIVLHGKYGEDGIIQGVLNEMKIPYTGCGVMASAIGMDKWRTKLVWKGAGLPIPPFYLLTDSSDFDSIEKELGLPLFVKPACEGSSIGVVKVKDAGQLKKHYELIKKIDSLVLAEKFIGGGEYTCSILGQQALPTIKIIPKTEFYDYEAKYNRDDTEYLCPSDLTSEDEKHIRNLSLQAFKVIGGKGWGRIDFLKDTDGQLYLLEANTVPGMTSHSLVPKAARQVGISFEDLCLEILEHADLE